MPRSALLSVLACGLTVVLISIGTSLFTAPIVDSVPFTGVPWGWFDVTHFSYNAHQSWHLDLLPSLLISLGRLAAPLVSLAILTIGTGLLFRSLGKTSVDASAAALFTTLLISGFLGLDGIVLQSISWLPWAAMLLRPRQARSTWKILLVCIFVAVSSWQLTPLVGGCLLFLSAAGDSRERTYIACLVLVGIFISASAPTPANVDYPPLARVVPDDGLAGVIRPLIGPASTIPIIDRDSIRQNFGPCAWPFLLGTFSLLWRHRRAPIRGEFAWRFLALSSLLFALVALDGSPIPESISTISPLETIVRIIPGLSFFSLAPLVFALACLFGTIGAFALCSEIGLGIVLVSGLTAALLLHPTDSPPGVAVSGNSTEILRELEVYLGDSSLTDTYEARVALSPSFSVLKHVGTSVLQTHGMRPRFLNISRFPHFKLRASAGNDTVQNVSDHEPATRWSTGRGRQLGDEWIEIELETSARILGVELNLGVYSTDFPRGLRVRVAPECSDIDNGEIVANYPRWLGAVHFSPKNELPYFGSESEVSMKFGRHLDGRCVRIEQTGQAPFDWSISELKLAVAGEPKIAE